MRRDSSYGGSSLELLLDTICNTFGGVLFLAILVCVLLKNTSPTLVEEVESISEAEMAELQRMHSESQSKLESLMLGASQQRKLIDQFAVPGKVELLNEFKARADARDRLLVNRSEEIEKLNDARKRIKQVESELRQLDQQIELAEREQATAEETLRAEVETRTQSGKLPRLRRSTKIEIGIIVRFDRVYLWHKYGLNNQRLGPNMDDFVVVKETSGAIEVTPKPYRGLPIAENDSFTSGMQAAVGRFPSESHCVVVVIWPDSFDKFEQVKKRLVSMGLEYRLMPMVTGEVVVDQGGKGGWVQ